MVEQFPSTHFPDGHFPDGHWPQSEPPAGGYAPAAPTLSVALSGTTATATITGDATATHTLGYQTAGDAGWTEGGTCSGSGTVVMEDLTPGNVYYFVAFAYSHTEQAYSQPSNLVAITVAITATSLFEEVLASVGALVLTAMDPITVVYKPQGSGARSISALVDFGGHETMEPGPRTNAPLFTVLVRNDPTAGISSTELDRARDLVSLPNHKGETTLVDRRIVQVNYEDYGMLELFCR